VKIIPMGIISTLAMTALLVAQAQKKPAASDQSLGELARKLSAEHKTQSTRPARVFTNENIPHRGEITVMGMPVPVTEGNSTADRDIPCKESALAWQFPELYYTMHSPLGRDEDTARGQAAKDAFKRACPCPSTVSINGSCPGYVIDHVRALACGGHDTPNNMAWQTVADGKAKDKWERKGCPK
jgi:hypothetical protein